ncbi:hypothetical protein C4D60_Mb06t14990 [Musa balbisiana]|uniref:Uncharacterized protein n=1 Tax=Musa balbisiana TaxID=52838 RepID=A0A4S8IQM0_MUSBA|nr:hypothetical protein C4D60_Mb06t14990 [Musa balbisiana]
MAVSAARQRRPPTADRDAPSSSSDRYSKEDKGEKKEEERVGVGWLLPALALGLLRHMSATSNIIHDCDEVFNYWEPLHYLLYKSGFQTWEYSEVRWVDDGFRGLLPFPFNSSFGGMAAAPPYFNDKNKASGDQYTLAAIPFLDRELSPATYRSFFIPYKWQEKNVFGLYKLLKKIPESGRAHT